MKTPPASAAVSPPARPMAALILAAGKGTRMRSPLAKVLHALDGRPMVRFSVDLARALSAAPIVLVVGHQADGVREAVPDRDVTFVEQREQLGTGHAVAQAREVLARFRGDVLILCGDVPLLRVETLNELVSLHRGSGAAVTVLTARLEDPGRYGRVIRSPGGAVLRIVEERDATEEEKAVKEINSGIYLADCPFLFDAVSRLTDRNAQKEYYLTDIFRIARERGAATAALAADDPREVLGINTPEELRDAERTLRLRGNDPADPGSPP